MALGPSLVTCVILASSHSTSEKKGRRRKQKSMMLSLSSFLPHKQHRSPRIFILFPLFLTSPTLAANRHLVFVLLLSQPHPLVTLLSEFWRKIGVFYWACFARSLGFRSIRFSIFDFPSCSYIRLRRASHCKDTLRDRFCHSSRSLFY